MAAAAGALALQTGLGWWGAKQAANAQKRGGTTLGDAFIAASKMHEALPCLHDTNGAFVAGPMAVASQRILGLDPALTDRTIAIGDAGPGYLLSHMPKGAKFLRPVKLRMIVGEPLHPPATEGSRAPRRAVRELTEESIQGLDLALCSAGGKVSAEWAPKLVEAGAVFSGLGYALGTVLLGLSAAMAGGRLAARLSP